LKSLIFLLFTIVFTAGTSFAQSSYTLGSGDLISIVVFDEEELTMEVNVAKTPMSYPFLGQVALDGRTLAEIEHQITTGLKGNYLIEPRVSISVIEYRPFFITGEVASPGGYPYQLGLTLRKAITLGGGFTERASKSKMVVARGGEGSEQKIQLSDPIFPDDVITIEQSFF
jgi:polysaccharide biosynthesis/export protein VpsN